MEKILHQILINIYDWRMWVVLICIPLLFAGSIYSCIQKRHDWGRKEIVLNMVPIWVFLLGGGLVFTQNSKFPLLEKRFSCGDKTLWRNAFVV